MESALNHLQVLEPRVEATQVVVPIALEIPDAWLVPPAPPGTSTAALSEAEVEALEQAFEPWDAFLVYSIRQVALDSQDGALRKRLFTLLLDSRYRVLDMLSGDAPAGSDPGGLLFLETWNELGALLAHAQRAGLLDASVLRSAGFIAARAPLPPLDRAPPGPGLRPPPRGR